MRARRIPKGAKIEVRNNKGKALFIGTEKRAGERRGGTERRIGERRRSLSEVTIREVRPAVKARASMASQFIGLKSRLELLVGEAGSATTTPGLLRGETIKNLSRIVRQYNGREEEVTKEDLRLLKAAVKSLEKRR